MQLFFSRKLMIIKFIATSLVLIYTLVASDRKHYQYISPLPDSKYISPSTSILLRFTQISPKDLTNLSSFIQIRGEVSGTHPGKIKIAKDGKTIIFRPDNKFTLGEEVNVVISPELKPSKTYNIEKLDYHFKISSSTIVHQNQPSEKFDLNNGLEIKKLNQKMRTNQPVIMENGVSVPSSFPFINVTTNNNPYEDYIFINNWGPPNYNIIFDNSGLPVWYLHTPNWDRRRDFKVQEIGMITMLVRGGYGRPNYDSVGNWGFIGCDKNFTVIDTFRATNGYNTDEHELLVLPDSGYFLIGRKEEAVDMSEYVVGGDPEATVRETCIQEFTSDGELIFEWRAWDHYDIRDLESESLLASYIRFPHMNAISIDDDENILLSSRHLSEITKIHRKTGDIIWRMSGAPKNNQFEFIGDDLNGFRLQHSIHALGNDHYLLYDNGNLHNPPLSRAVEYLIDTVSSPMTASLVWEYREDDNYSYYMGNVQRLPNGNTLINWAVGELPKVTEVSADGFKTYEMNFIDEYDTYRSFKYPWQGMVEAPYLLIEPQPDNITLLFNKFGDSNVDYYKIYGGTTRNPVTVVDTSKLTLKRITNLENDQVYYFRVTAVSNTGDESDFSDERSVFVNIIPPGQNLVLNGDFSLGEDGWIWEVSGSGIADWNIIDEVSHFDISNGGDQYYNIQLRQNSIGLIRGKKYIFEFDAWADANRIIEAKVGQDEDPWINYSKIGPFEIKRTSNHYVFPFTMEDPTDSNARVVFNLGTSDVNVYLDNVSVVMDVESSISDKKNYLTKYALCGNFPNPFNIETTITYELPEKSYVSIKIFNLSGELVKELKNIPNNVGTHSVRFNASSLSSGIYFYVLYAQSISTQSLFQDTKKMVFVK